MQSHPGRRVNIPTGARGRGNARVPCRVLQKTAGMGELCRAPGQGNGKKGPEESESLEDHLGTLIRAQGPLGEETFKKKNMDSASQAYLTQVSLLSVIRLLVPP